MIPARRLAAGSANRLLGLGRTRLHNPETAVSSYTNGAIRRRRLLVWGSPEVPIGAGPDGALGHAEVMSKPSKRGPDRVPADKLLGDLSFYPAPSDETPAAAFILIKTRDSKGRAGWYSRVSQTYNQMEFFGALVAYAESERTGMAAGFFEDDAAPPDHVG